MTRARMPRPHEVAAARRDPRLLRALSERQLDDAWRTRGVCQSVDPETFFPAPRDQATGGKEPTHGGAAQVRARGMRLRRHARWRVWPLLQRTLQGEREAHRVALSMRTSGLPAGALT